MKLKQILRDIEIYFKKYRQEFSVILLEMSR